MRHANRLGVCHPQRSAPLATRLPPTPPPMGVPPLKCSAYVAEGVTHFSSNFSNQLPSAPCACGTSSATVPSLG
jgi:hypothetical protein